MDQVTPDNEERVGGDNAREISLLTYAIDTEYPLWICADDGDAREEIRWYQVMGEPPDMLNRL